MTQDLTLGHWTKNVSPFRGVWGSAPESFCTFHLLEHDFLHIQTEYIMKGNFTGGAEKLTGGARVRAGGITLRRKCKRDLLHPSLTSNISVSKIV